MRGGLVIFTVKQLMTKEHFALRCDATIQDAATSFLKNGLQRVPVLDYHGKPLGVITSGSFLIALVAGIDLSSPVTEVLIRDYYSVHEDSSLEVLARYPIETVLVVDEAGRLCGVMTKADMNRSVGQQCWIHNSQLKDLLNSLPSGILSIDSEGTVMLCNSYAGKLLGVTPEDILGRNIAEVTGDGALLRIVGSGQAEKSERVVLNGITVLRSRFPAVNEGITNGAVELLQNISEVESLVEELTGVKALYSELETIFESLHDGIVVTDCEGRLLRASRSYSRISGIPWEQVEQRVGRPIEEIEVGRQMAAPANSLVQSKRTPVTITGTSPEGKELVVSANPVFDSEGKLARIVCNIRDMSELNELKREIQENKNLTARYFSELEELRARQLQLDGIVVNSSEMKRAVETAVRVAAVDSTVLITGETGTGKEIIAKIIHKYSPRKNGPFITVNCGAIPESLLESELFGYEKGAFTGANREGKLGILELANNGTVFLDEIGDLPLLLQVKMLRVLQEQEFVRVGGTKPVRLNLRILAATNRNLEQMVADKTFREDLFYRLNVIPIHLPPLRQRREDIIPLAVHFLDKYGKKHNLKKKLAADSLNILEQYAWPGNVRELENQVERVLIMSDGDLILPRHLPNFLSGKKEQGAVPITVHNILPLKEAGEILEKELLSQALTCGRSTRKVATILGVDHSTIVRKLNKYQLVVNKDK